MRNGTFAKTVKKEVTTDAPALQFFLLSKAGRVPQRISDHQGEPDMTAITTPAIDGMHHIKFAVADPDQSLAFYESVFGAKRIARADHRDADGSIYAYICEVPGLGTLIDLRLSKSHAQTQRGFDPVTLNIADRSALHEWVAHLDALGVSHSGEIVTALAFMLVIEDPDGRRIRLYTREKHGPELTGVKDHPWMML